ncbi:hypothetical protein DL93DRAFT_2187662 [Clavulina sp. PMI_390]|nr:hypothetical protein DL93DRAFT_2187662 [Clavulina sp. PMI_390]
MPPTLRRRNAVDEQGGSTVERAAQASHSDNTTMLEARLSGNDGPEDEGDDIDSGTKKVKKTRAQFSFEHCHSILVAVLKHRPHAAEFGALGKTWDLVCDEVNREHGTEWRKDVIRKKSQELLDTHRLGNRSAWKSKHISMDDEQHQLLASLLDAWQGECEAIDAENASRAQARDKVAQQRIDDDNESRDLAMQTLGETRSANCAEQDQERSADSEEDENDLESSPSRPKRPILDFPSQSA